MICLHTNCRLSNSKDQFIIAMKPKARYVHHTFATPSDILQDPSPQKFPEFYNSNSSVTEHPHVHMSLRLY